MILYEKVSNGVSRYLETLDLVVNALMELDNKDVLVNKGVIKVHQREKSQSLIN